MENYHSHEYKDYVVEISTKRLANESGFTGTYRIIDSTGALVNTSTTPILLSAEMADKVTLSLGLGWVDEVLKQEGTTGDH